MDELAEVRRRVDAAHSRLDAIQERVTKMEVTLEVTLGEIRGRLDSLAGLPEQLAALQAEIKATRRDHQRTSSGDWQKWTIAALGWLFALIALILGHLIKGGG